MKQPKSGWRARSLICGYFASTSMLIVLMVSYALMLVVAGADQGWAQQLTDNTLTVAAFSYPYLAILAHFVVGTLLAMVYGGYAEPRLSGPSWRKGLLFAGPLYAASVMLLGLGMVLFNMDAGAGPILGNLILHAVYGITLGGLFGMLSHYELAGVRGEAVRAGSRRGARGMALGALCGWVIAALGLMLGGSDGFAVANFHDSWAHLAGILTGSALGCLIGVVEGEDEQNPQLATRLSPSA